MKMKYGKLKDHKQSVLDVLSDGNPMRMAEISEKAKHIDYTRVAMILKSLQRDKKVTRIKTGIYQLGNHPSDTEQKGAQIVRILEESDFPMRVSEILSHFDKESHRNVTGWLSIKLKKGEISLLDKGLYTSAGFGDYRKGVKREFTEDDYNLFMDLVGGKQQRKVMNCLWETRGKKMNVEELAELAGVSTMTVYRVRTVLISIGWRFINVGNDFDGKLYCLNEMMHKEPA